MVFLLIGAVLLVATYFLLRWGVPKAGRPSPVPTRWGMATAFPMLVMTTGIVGLVFVLKGIFPG